MERSETITAEELAARLGCSRNLVYAAARSGDIPSLRVGGRVLFTQRAIERWLECERPQEVTA